MPNSNIKLCIRYFGGDEWKFGITFLTNLIKSIKLVNDSGIDVFVLVEKNELDSLISRSLVDQNNIIILEYPDRWKPVWMLYQLLKKSPIERDIVIEDLLLKKDVDVYFAPTIIHKVNRIKTLSLVADFQHVHLPHMFSRKEVSRRNRNYRLSAKIADLIILFSNAVMKDYHEFAPKYLNKMRVLRPVSFLPQDLYEKHLGDLFTQYNIPEKFFFIPNQFWKHKNHEIVFRAVKDLNKTGIKINIVCSGNPIDYRDSDYFSNLQAKLNKWKIQDQIFILGIIPYIQVLQFIRQCICVINPSLFEGWGMTVDEARSIGKQVLISDIPAHREQNVEKLTYFNPYSIEHLKRELVRIWCEASPGPDYDYEKFSRSKIAKRQKNNGESFISLVKESIN